MADQCPISKQPAIVRQDHGGSRIYHVESKLVGNYSITRTAARKADGLEDEKRLKLVWYLRNNHENRYKTEITSENLERLSESIEPAFDPIDRVNRIMIYMFKKLKKPSDTYDYDVKTDYPIAYAADSNEFAYYLSLASKMGLIDVDSSTIQPTLKGWEYYRDLKKSSAFTNQAFVAMWFDSQMDDAWSNGFKKALDETDYSPLRIDISEHNDKICDRIHIEIRRSSLLVTDFTGNRGGVYFEAGLALGLGIPVIWTCRDDYIDDLHFDTRQYNHIVWSDSDDLLIKLKNRIKATIPGKLEASDA